MVLIIISQVFIYGERGKKMIYRLKAIEAWRDINTIDIEFIMLHAILGPYLSYHSFVDIYKPLRINCSKMSDIELFVMDAMPQYCNGCNSNAPSATLDRFLIVPQLGGLHRYYHTIPDTILSLQTFIQVKID